MTVNALHKLLLEMIANGLGRCQIAINKDTFTHNLAEVTMHDICGWQSLPLAMIDGDGFAIINKDGSERIRTTVFLYGAAGQPCCGLLYEQCQCAAGTSGTAT